MGLAGCEVKTLKLFWLKRESNQLTARINFLCCKQKNAERHLCKAVLINSTDSRVKFSIIQLTWPSIVYGEGNGTPLQYSCLENPMDGGAWQAAVHGVTKSRTRLSDFTVTFHFHALEKEMAAHSSVLAWIIPGTGKLGGCRLWGLTELDTTEVTQQQQHSVANASLMCRLFGALRAYICSS